MINKKTIAIKQDVNQTVRSLLSQIGRVYEIPFTDGRKTLGVILTYEGVRRLGIDLNTVFRDCEGRKVFNERTDVKNGILVNLDLYQQVALIRAIIGKRPKLADKLGLYNLRGSIKVYEVLNRARVLRYLEIWFMWTGDANILEQPEGAYPEEGIITLSSLSALKGNRFFYRFFDGGRWGSCDPDFYSNDGAVIFGAQI